MPDRKEYLTKEKYDELNKELEYLKKDKRREVAESLESAKSLGDLSENAEYHEARDMQAEIEDRIAKLESVLKFAEIVSGGGTSAVTIGSKITLLKEKDNSEHAFAVVGSEESDLGTGKISIHSPLGAAAIGKRRGESFEVNTPKGLVKYKITKLS